jgi:hypothetical protein
MLIAGVVAFVAVVAWLARARFTRSAVTLLVAAGLAPLLAVGLGSTAGATVVPTVGMGTAANFSVLAGTTVTNKGPTTLNRNLGLSPGSSVTGFPPGIVTPPATQEVANPVAVQAQKDLTTAYNDAHGRTADATTGAQLANQTLAAGVYSATTTKDPFLLDGTLTLDGANDPSSVFIFQTDSTITTGTASVVRLINGALPCNVFWQIGSSATLGTGTTFVGNILALTSITLQDSVTVEGRALAMNGAVTLLNDTFTGPNCAAPTTTSGATTTTLAATTSTAGATTSTAGVTTTTSGATTTTAGATTTTSGATTTLPAVTTTLPAAVTTMPAATTTMPAATTTLPAATTTLPAAVTTMPAATTTLPAASTTLAPAAVTTIAPSVTTTQLGATTTAPGRAATTTVLGSSQVGVTTSTTNSLIAGAVTTTTTPALVQIPRTGGNIRIPLLMAAAAFSLGAIALGLEDRRRTASSR